MLQEGAVEPRRPCPGVWFPTLFLVRTTWNGSISFGLVNIPVGLAPATASSARQSDVQFKLLHRECLTPIKQKRWCPVHDVELSPDEIVRGWEVSKGQFVPIEDVELEALESYDTSRSIEIRQFVAADEIDPVYFDRTYFLVPAATEAQRRPYALLLEAMREVAVVGIGAFVLAGKEKLCLIRPKGKALALETLFLAEDVRDQQEIDEPVAATGVKKEELALAKQIISSLEGSFDPSELRSDYRAKLRELLEAKLAGREVLEATTAEDEVAPVVDLMEALRASVAASKGTQAKASGPATRRKRATTAR
jgi:DNA end-binding protein Ku